MTDNKPTIAQLRADEALLRRTIGEVLNIREWTSNDTIPPGYHSSCVLVAFSDSLADAAEQLVKKLTAMPAHQWYKPFLDTLRSLVHADGDTVMWWLIASPTDRCICCLLGIGAAKMEGA